jgi:hypothetical protein
VAGRILRVTAINGFTANPACIAVKGKVAVAADEHVWIPGFGHNVDGFADQADGRHVGLVPDAIAVFTVAFVEFSDRFLVNGFHEISPEQSSFLDSSLCNFIAVMGCPPGALFSNPGFLHQKSCS